MTKYTITIKATSITVEPGEESMPALMPLLNILTYEDEFIEETKTLGFLYDESRDILYLHKGVDIQYLQKLLGDTEIKFDLYDEYDEMHFDYEEIIAPRDDDQIDVINFISGMAEHQGNMDESQLFLVKKPGFGKAEPYSRKIPTPTPQGFTLMGDLKIGDHVFDRTGRLTKVTDIFEQGVQDVYEVTFNDGRTARCMGDHLWTVKTSNGPYRDMKLIDIMKDYKILSKWKINNNREDPYCYKYYIPICEPVQYTTRNVSVDPWVLGCFIGNGCCLERILTISSPDARIPSAIANICGFVYKKLSNENYSYSFYDKTTGKPILTKEFFKDLSHPMWRKAGEKTIPQEYLVNDVDTRRLLLQGLMDTDGSISYGDGRYHVTYSSTSKELLYQIQWLVYLLGFSATLVDDKRPEKYTTGFCGILVFRVPNEYKKTLFLNSSKFSLAVECADKPQRIGPRGLLIKDIKLIGQEQCRCIMVDNAEHLYLTENFIVTHNTFCTGVGLCKLKMKTLIIMHRDQLRGQWENSLRKMCGLTSQDVHEIDSSEELYAIAHNQHGYDYDVYLMTHATFRAGLKRLNTMEEAMNITKNLKIGFKVIDEAHLEFRDTILMDFCFNVKRNLYLTATDGRSSKEENSIFRHVFANALYYKPSAFLTDNNRPKKWVEYISVAINTNCNKNIYRYRVAGGRGMSPATYGRWVIAYDKKKTHIKCCTEIVKMVYESDPHAKILLFMPLIDLCEDCAFYITSTLDKDKSFMYDLDIRTINSKNSKKDNERAKHADVIVTTIGSCGTGTDIPGITTIISCSPFVSKITAAQVFGRIRYCGKVCQYYDIYDVSVQMDYIWWKSRRKGLTPIALNVKNLVWDEEQPT